MDVSVDWSALGFWLSIGQWVFNVLVAWFMWVNRRHRATNTRVKDLRKELTDRVDAAEKEILGVKGCVDGLPTQKQIEDMSKEMSDLSTQLGEVKGRLGGINRAVDIINQFLIEQGGHRDQGGRHGG